MATELCTSMRGIDSWVVNLVEPEIPAQGSHVVGAPDADRVSTSTTFRPDTCLMGERSGLLRRRQIQFMHVHHSPSSHVEDICSKAYPDWCIKSKQVSVDFLNALMRRY
jgi:hypothetical protein